MLKNIEQFYSPSTVDIALVVVVFLLALLAFYKGRRSLCSLIVSFYPAISMYDLFPYKENLIFFKQDQTQSFLSHLSIFAVFFLAVFYVLRRITQTNNHRTGVPGLIDSLLLGVSFIALSFFVVFHLSPPAAVYGLDLLSFYFLKTDIVGFLMLLLPLGVLYRMS